MVCVGGGQMPELLGQSETVSHMFRRYKVLSHLDAAVEVVHLGGVRKRMTVMWAQTKDDESNSVDGSRMLLHGDCC